MRIEIAQAGKKFRQEWIFRHLNLHIETGAPCAVLGPNGSGKSTFIKILAGVWPLSQGQITYYDSQGKVLEPENWFRQLAWAAPYLELTEEFTALELLLFHHKFKPIALSPKQFFEKTQLFSARHKPIKHFSSGMKQRLKLGLAFYGQAPVLLFDEPTVNLDQATQAWYLEEMSALLPKRLVVIGSNQQQEYAFCQQQLYIPDFKSPGGAVGKQ
ncbi:MAG: heme ABC exporter ATP-binding protein CcmA [Microscillaceae bacterium]